MTAMLDNAAAVHENQERYALVSQAVAEVDSRWGLRLPCRPRRVVGNDPQFLRAAARGRFTSDTRYGNLMGFRVGRTLTP